MTTRVGTPLDGRKAIAQTNPQNREPESTMATPDVWRPPLTPTGKAGARPHPVHFACPPQLKLNAAKFLENNGRASFLEAHGHSTCAAE
jgi:hypothetical protein